MPQQPTNLTQEDEQDVIIDGLACDLLQGNPIKRQGPYSKATFDDLLVKLLEHSQTDAAVLEIIAKYPQTKMYQLCADIAREMAEEVLDQEADFFACQAEDIYAGRNQ